MYGSQGFTQFLAQTLSRFTQRLQNLILAVGSDLLLCQQVAAVAVDCLQPQYILATQGRDRTFDGGRAGGALADLACYFKREPGILGLGHQGERLRNALVRQEVQKRGLLEL